MPGNCIITSLSLVTETPPSCVQKRWCAAISVTLRCTCPMAAPVLLGEASCAGRGAAAITARARRVRMLIGAYYIRLRGKSNRAGAPRAPPLVFPRLLVYQIVRLENHLQRKLNVPGVGCQGVQTSAVERRSVRVEQLGRAIAKKGQGRQKVGVIQDVEKLRPELHAEALRNLLDGEVLVHREIKVDQRRSDN